MRLERGTGPRSRGGNDRFEMLRVDAEGISPGTKP
jgi:hypothetical protein